MICTRLSSRKELSSEWIAALDRDVRLGDKPAASGHGRWLAP